MFSIRKYYKSETKILTNTTVIKIERLEQELFRCKTKDEILIVLNNNTDIVEKFLKLKPEENIDDVANRMQTMIQDETMQDLYNEVQTKFYEIKEIEKDLNTAFIALKKLYPEIKIPKVITIITGLIIELPVDHDLIVIGLDYFLGPESKYQPWDKPKYWMHTYTKKYIVPKILFNYVQQFIGDDYTDKSMLAEMICYGKISFFIKTILPTIDEPTLFYYTNEQFNEAEESEDLIWNHFTKNKLLFSTNPIVNSNYISIKEFTPEIHPTCPGAIARWLAYKIIKSYMKHNSSVSIVELMNNKNANQIFTKSEYKPFNS